MEQETPTLQPEEPTVTQLPEEVPADDMQEDDDDDGLQQQLQRAEHLTMTLERVNVRDSDSELSKISDEDDEEEPDDKMSQKDEDQDERPDQDEWRWMPLESGRWQGAQLLRLERQWQDARFPKLGTEAIGCTHKLQQRRRPMSLRQASMTTCLTRMVELRRGYPGLDSRRRGRA